MNISDDGVGQTFRKHADMQIYLEAGWSPGGGCVALKLRINHTLTKWTMYFCANLCDDLKHYMTCALK